jgi:hypothetical protein
VPSSVTVTAELTPGPLLRSLRNISLGFSTAASPSSPIANTPTCATGRLGMCHAFYVALALRSPAGLRNYAGEKGHSGRFMNFGGALPHPWRRSGF